MVARSGGGVRLCGHERKTREGEVRKGSETKLLPASPPLGGMDASPFFSFFAVVSVLLFTLCRCTFSRIFLLVGLLVSFLILSHDFYETFSSLLLGPACLVYNTYRMC